jgi:organic radical activating enzyme
MTKLPMLKPFSELNYIGVFLTFGCNLACPYCINDPEQASRRDKIFNKKTVCMTPKQWVEGLSRFPENEGLPITLQGGEPTVYFAASGLGELLKGTPHKFDLLTNLVLDTPRLEKNIDGQTKKLQRSAPYPSIRVSYHPSEMKRVWGENAFYKLVEQCENLAKIGFNVTAEKATSDVGIYMVAHPDNHITQEELDYAKTRVPFETKEFLGSYNGELYGTYKYPCSTDLIENKHWHETLNCDCRTTEVLIDPLGFVWRCHSFLYETWAKIPPSEQFKKLETLGFEYKEHKNELFDDEESAPVGHILDPKFELDDLREFRCCSKYGICIGCDTKVKNNRFQSLYDMKKAHTSVEIINLKAPEELKKIFPEFEAFEKEE